MNFVLISGFCRYKILNSFVFLSLIWRWFGIVLPLHFVFLFFFLPLFCFVSSRSEKDLIFGCPWTMLTFLVFLDIVHHVLKLFEYIQIRLINLFNSTMSSAFFSLQEKALFSLPCLCWHGCDLHLLFLLFNINEFY